MASGDSSLFPLPIYFSDEQSESAENGINKQVCGRARGSGRWIDRGPRRGGNYARGSSASSTRSLSSSRDNIYYKNYEENEHNSDENIHDKKYKGRWQVRGRGYRDRGRARGNQQNYVSREDGAGMNAKTSADDVKEKHWNKGKYKTVTEEDQETNFSRRGGNGRTRGHCRRMTVNGLSIYQSETSLNLESSGEPAFEPNRKTHRPSKTQKVRNEILGSDADNNTHIDGGEIFDKDVQKPREIHLGYKRLEELSKMTDDADDLVLIIGNSRSGLVECLEKPLKPDWVHRILEIMSIAVKTQTCTHTLRELLLTIEDLLWPKLNEFLSQILIESEQYKHMFEDKNKLECICILVISLLKHHMSVLPMSLGKCIPIILLLKQIQSEHKLEREQVLVEIKELDAIKDLIKEERDNHRQRITRYTKHDPFINVDCEPPESFRELGILPSAEDLLYNDELFLRPNIEEGKYKDLDQYLDVHFRLLREDYMRPLREGIRDYKTGLTSVLDVRKVRDIRLYHNVQVMMPVCTLSGICHVLQFDTKPFKRINWSTSRRLLYGSLVCLSPDDFDTIIFGTVTERNPKDLTNGQIEILLENTNDIIEIKPNVTYLMAESTAYFEAYRHILGGLQEIKETLPLQRYVIECETEILTPKYLQDQGLPMYDFTCVLSEDAIRRDTKLVPVLKTDKWPQNTDLSFDSSQMEAMKLALTKELVLIQGPPGTGKTYVGLKIAKMLLANKEFWIGEGKQTCPILVVCYTNHALDQFLEGIYTFCKANIVRVGGRSRNMTLEPFLLKNLREKRRSDKSRSIGIARGERDCMMHLKRNKSQIERVSEKIRSCSKVLIPLTTEAPQIISQKHYESLHRRISYKQRDKALGIWLGLTTEEDETYLENLEKLSPKAKLKTIWKDMILNDVIPMTEEEASCVNNIYELDLYKRGRLYKAWISDCIKILEHMTKKPFIGNFSKTNQQSEIEAMKKTILNLERLTHFNLSPRYQLQINQLKKALLAIPYADCVKSWLCLDLSLESTDRIKHLIENPPKEPTDDDDKDLEEERQLDEEDTEDFLQGYKSKDVDAKLSSIHLNESDWTTVVRERKIERKLQKMLNRPTTMSDDDVASVDDVWDVPLETRKDLYRYWVRKYRTFLRQEITEQEAEYQNAVQKYKEVLDLETLDILRSATVIGMTTTGAAKNRTLLQKAGPKIIIVEEAAEVLESHIITTLNENCQHLILIGDHKQLRPNPTVYDLAKRYKLDISLFERMIKNNVPCVTLSEQHRMRPEISVLMRHKNLYPNLSDHPSVAQYERVLGVGNNVCFINHKEPEEQSADSTSYYNTHEAEFLASLCKYLLMQGYKAEQITVLSPYMRQVLALRKAMPNHEFSGVRITPVDNFQGEENDIILLSLVRSDVQDKRFSKRNPIGFLGIENRVCVALSRAKKGLFVVGNFEHLAAHSEMWQYMVDTMHGSNRLKKSITLRCQNHSESAFDAAIPDDFKKAPEGGCMLSCNFPLQCGHICQRFCHVLDKNHELYKCFKPCAKTNPCGHKCQKKCCEKCHPCKVLTEKTIPKCGHKAYIQCNVSPEVWMCSETCTAKLPCGHTCGLKCGECWTYKHKKERCEIIVKKKLPCGHVTETKCGLTGKEVPCPHPCRSRLSCGHTCSGTCGECLEGRIHKSCKGTCNKLLPCGHHCSFPCSEVCPPCSRQCEWVCSHNIRCPNKCSEECRKCNEECAVKCPHMKCTKTCSEECDNIKCDKPCKTSLKCGHRCAGLCGEICPRLCPVCKPTKLEKPDDKVVFLKDCKCTVSVKRLDHRMEKTLKEGKSRVVPFYRCPECNKPITKVIKRYINYMKNRRKLIAERYLSLAGTFLERQRESRRLQTKLKKLKMFCLSRAKITELEEQELKRAETDFSGLYNLRRKTELLEETLKLISETERSKSENKQYVLKQANKIIELLMVNRKYVTSQFWNEAHDEIKRLRQALYNAYVKKAQPTVKIDSTCSHGAEGGSLENTVRGIDKLSLRCSPDESQNKHSDVLDEKRTKDIDEIDLASDEVNSFRDGTKV